MPIYMKTFHGYITEQEYRKDLPFEVKVSLPNLWEDNSETV